MFGLAIHHPYNKYRIFKNPEKKTVGILTEKRNGKKVDNLIETNTNTRQLIKTKDAL